MQILKRYAPYALLALLGFFMLVLAFVSQYKEPSGDSYSHFLISRYAFRHPHLFLDHWGKPVFTLLSAPFYVWGYAYMPIFNIVITLFTALLIYLFVSKNFAPAFGLFALVAFYASPQVFYHQFSAFTEPLFSLFLLAIIVLVANEKFSLAALVCGFLPFVRSEGFIMALVLLPYLLIVKQYKALPWLLLGFLIYAFIGWAVLDDFWWFFSKNPYDRPSDHYGSGPWSHFFEHYPTVCGYPIAGLMCVGLVSRWTSWIKKIQAGDFKAITSDIFLLIHALFFAYFLAHVVFWKFGIFSSFGLLRVMTAIAGLGILITADGLSFIAGLFRLRKIVVISAFSLFVAFWPFSENNTGFQLERNFTQSRDIQSLAPLQNWFSLQYFQSRLIFYSHPCLPLYLDFDPFNSARARPLDHYHAYSLPLGSIILWDEYYSSFEHRLSKDTLLSTEGIKLLGRFSQNEGGYEYAVFEVE